MFKFLVRQLLQGKALSVEDMAELLSLKDNRNRVEDYASALHLLARAEVCRMLLKLLLMLMRDTEPTKRPAAQCVQERLATHLHSRRVSPLLAFLHYAHR